MPEAMPAAEVLQHNSSVRERIWLGINILTAFLSVLAGIGQILDFLQSGKLNLIWVSLLGIVSFVLTIGVVLIWRRRVQRKLELFLLCVSLLVLGVTIGVGITVHFRTLPSPSVLYQTYVSTNDDDARYGLPVVFRSHANPPRNEYKVKRTLGYGYPLEPNIPGTHLIYDHFCTGRGSENPCGGVRRSHYVTRNQSAPSPWPKPADEVKPVARLLDAEPDGQCPHENDVAIHRFSLTTPRGAVLYDIAVQADGWHRAELLGCLRRVN